MLAFEFGEILPVGFPIDSPKGCSSYVARKWRGPDLVGIKPPAATCACIMNGVLCILIDGGEKSWHVYS
jgi:hypothetical protein